MNDDARPPETDSSLGNSDDEWPDLDAPENAPASAQPSGGAAPILATLADSSSPSEEPIRVGSPFAVDPLEKLSYSDRPVEAVVDGSLRYTAIGAVTAAAMVLVFAAAAAWWFPAGGTMIAALGCVLSIFGLYSTYRYTAAGFLMLHLSLFVFSYGRSFG